jgi:hypothetical protein
VTHVAWLAAVGILTCCLAASAGMAPAMHASTSPRQATPGAPTEATDPFEAPGAVPVSLVIANAGDTDRLLGGSSPVAACVAVHQTRLVDGRREMTAPSEGIVIPGGKTSTLEPGLSHLMLIGLTEDLIQGQTFPLSLRFEHAGEMDVTARVRRRVDAAGLEPMPPVVVGGIRLSLASVPPAPAETHLPLDATRASCGKR